MTGIYIHIPFCNSKCPYCDFYSYRTSEREKAEYVNRLTQEINTLQSVKKFVKGDITADTIYLGGGTPSALSGEQLFNIIECAKKKFNTPDDAEITVECNPSSDIEKSAPYLKKAGVNRISLGMQSSIDKERKILGRTSGKERVIEVINILKKLGITNISLDVMLGVPHQTKESLDETLRFCISSGATHISAYMLKLEENTFFYKNQDKYVFPSEEEVCDMYIQCCETLADAGFNHYEISNFALPDFESRHNTKYWELENYIGIGPSAHSYYCGKRFYYPDSTEAFISRAPAVFDGNGGGYDEYIMLRLRLKKGLNINELESIYGGTASKKIKNKAPFLNEQGLVNFDNESLSLTEKGFLLSNTIINEFI
ncbi:MAG: radical SAM family heme chaperone HemW [Acutalibacteraceae bacterium]